MCARLSKEMIAVILCNKDDSDDVMSVFETRIVLDAIAANWELLLDMIAATKVDEELI